MKKRTFRSSVVAFTFVALAASAGAATPPAEDALRAYAKLYGYVRFFHPSDEAAAVDWDAFAVHGAATVLAGDGQGSNRDLLETLQGLIEPIAPTACLYWAPASPCEPHVPELESSEVVEWVAWQHRGVGLGKPGLYRSVRTHRPIEVALDGSQGFGTVVQSIDARPHRGQQVRLRAKIRAEVDGPGNQAQMWLRIDRDEGRGFFDNMADRPITDSEWGDYEIVGTIAADATQIVFGAFLNGIGAIWMDAVEVAVRSSNDQPWQDLTVVNPGFEDHAKELPGWKATSPGFAFGTDDDEAAVAARSLHIAALTGKLKDGGFNETPAPGEVFEYDLGAGLRLRMPLALPSMNGRTVPQVSEAMHTGLLNAFEAIDPMTPNAGSLPLRVAAVTVAWNVFQHFYPYFDVIDGDWDSALTDALRGARDASDERAFRQVLQRLGSVLQDGHVSVRSPSSLDPAGLPLRLDWVEEHVVITASAVPEIAIGDVVRTIDGRDATALMHERASLVSGSPQWKRVRALGGLGRGAADSVAQLVIRRDGKDQEHAVERIVDIRPSESRPASFDAVADGVLYLDLSNTPWPDIEPRLTELAAARGVVFDLRGYPRGNHAVLQHLTDEVIESARWNVPRTIYPDRKELVGYDTSGRWNLPPLTPRFGGQAVFLTDGRAISYAESVLGIVEHYGLAEIVGSPTAGANGNVNPFVLPGGYRLSWTGMKVLKHDGSQHHLVGIQPTIPAARTLQGIRGGRDELLERAVAVFSED